VNDPIRLLVDALTTTVAVAGPLLAVALAAGLAVGVLQAVVQVNEASLSFIVKLVCVAAVLTVLGGTLAGSLVSYAHRCFAEVERVVR
jgi:flagellar biosynthetic protein FliQ